MVCEKNADVAHDFMTDPIRLVGEHHRATAAACRRGRRRLRSNGSLQAAAGSTVLYCRGCLPTGVPGCLPACLQVRQGDWITADGTTLGSDNGGCGLGVFAWLGVWFCVALLRPRLFACRRAACGRPLTACSCWRRGRFSPPPSSSAPCAASQ